MISSSSSSRTLGLGHVDAAVSTKCLHDDQFCAHLFCWVTVIMKYFVSSVCCPHISQVFVMIFSSKTVLCLEVVLCFFVNWMLYLCGMKVFICHYLFHSRQVQYNLSVLKVPLHVNQPTYFHKIGYVFALVCYSYSLFIIQILNLERKAKNKYFALHYIITR